MEIMFVMFIFSFCASIYLLIRYVSLNIDYQTIKRKTEYNEEDIRIIKSDVAYIRNNTTMIDDIPINLILWELISLCGYRYEQHYAPKFKLVKKEVI